MESNSFKQRNKDLEDEMAVKIYKALGEPTRLQLVKSFVSQPEMSCEVMANHLDKANSTITHHLKILIDCGLLTVRNEGTYRYYRIQREVLEKYAPVLIPDHNN